MRRIYFIELCGFIFYITCFFISCKQDQDKKESWALVIDFFSPDISYYRVSKNFPIPDSLQYAPLDIFFTNQDKSPIITDSTIIFFNSYRINGEKLCCTEDTLEIFTDIINGKKYLFAIGEYITVFQADTNLFADMRTRRNITPVSPWGIQLNTAYSSEKFKDEYEKLGARFVKLDERIDEVYRQKWGENDSILVETIRFKNSNERWVTQVYKDITQHESDSITTYLKKIFPKISIKEIRQPGDEGESFKITRMYFQGIAVSITQTSVTTYSFTMTDFYETIKLIIKNSETGYIFRDDVSIY